MIGDPNTTLQTAIDVFLRVLRNGWLEIESLAHSSDSLERNGLLSDWAQGSWELIVEAAVAATISPGRTFLEPYGEGADCNPVGSRIWMPGAKSTHAVFCVPRIGSGAWDHLLQAETTFPPGGLLFDRFATRTQAGWYEERPPFDHVLTRAGGHDALFRLTDVSFALVKLEDRRSAKEGRCGSTPGRESSAIHDAHRASPRSPFTPRRPTTPTPKPPTMPRLHLPSPHHHRLLLLALLHTPACAGARPFELPADLQAPSHACAETGVAACEQACNEDADGGACLVASVAHGMGLGTPKDEASMQAFERRACELGVALGCEYFANNFWSSKDEDDRDLAREHYERACRGGRADSCSRAGALALELDAEGEPQDARAAFELYVQACDGGRPSACAVVGDMLTFGIGTRPDAERAAASFRKACEGGFTAGCHNAEAHDEHWLAGQVSVLLEPLHAPDPVFVLENAPNGWRTVVVTRTCFTHEALEPVVVRIQEPSGHPEVDAVVLETLQGWRFRTRPGRTFERPVCVPNVFDIRKQ